MLLVIISQKHFVRTLLILTRYQVCADLDKHCNETRWNNFTVEEVIFACSALKPNKKDAGLSLNSLSIINASHNFYVALCLLINIVIVHDYTPLAWQAGTIVSLLKSRSLDKSLLTSHKPITLSSLIDKIIDLLIINRYNDVLYSSECQFGFKKGHSTNMSTFVVKEVVSYYINNDSAVCSCVIDMSKAFDRVDLVKLFKRLSLRALPVYIIRILFVLYYNLCIKVSWNGCFSESFYMLNGVKQGRILSPSLFSIFINDLL